MTKITPVNLDELASPQKSIILDAVRHDMRELTVQEFIDQAKKARDVQDEKVEDFDSLAFDQKVEKLRDMVADAFPTITKERLGKLHFAQLNAILDLIVKTPEQIAEGMKDKAGNA